MLGCQLISLVVNSFEFLADLQYPVFVLSESGACLHNVDLLNYKSNRINKYNLCPSNPNYRATNTFNIYESAEYNLKYRVW